MIRPPVVPGGRVPDRGSLAPRSQPCPTTRLPGPGGRSISWPSPRASPSRPAASPACAASMSAPGSCWPPPISSRPGLSVGRPEGVVTEVAGEADRRGAATRTARYLRPGAHRQFGSPYVHDVNNDGEVDAISVHVYGPRLTTMTYYELDRGGRPEAVRTEEIEPVGPFDT